MSNIIPFDFNGNQVRTFIGEDGEPWFIAKDVAQILGYSQTNHMNQVLDDEDKDKRTLELAGNYQNQSLINESGLYAAIFSSRKEEAKTFKRWVTSEVLPQIRKTGSYQLQPKSQAEQLLAQAQVLVEYEKRLKEVEEKEVENTKRLDQIETGIDHFTVIGYARAYRGESLDLKSASKIGKEATKLCNNMGILMGSVPDPRFGEVNTYPKSVLDEVFDT